MRYFWLLVAFGRMPSCRPGGKTRSVYHSSTRLEHGAVSAGVCFADDAGTTLMASLGLDVIAILEANLVKPCLSSYGTHLSGRSSAVDQLEYNE